MATAVMASGGYVSLMAVTTSLLSAWAATRGLSFLRLHFSLDFWLSSDL